MNFAFNCRFDANAPYTGTALGITTKLPRRPYNEWTTRNKNIACLYAGRKLKTFFFFKKVNDFLSIANGNGS